VQTIADSLDGEGRASKETAAKALIFVRALAAGVQNARDTKPARAVART
jgi:hypothetical protein